MRAHFPVSINVQAHRGLLLVAMIFSLVTITAYALETNRAYAGEWAEASCMNPDQSGAPNQGWSSLTTGSPGAGSYNSTACGTSTAMLAMLSTASASPVFSGEVLQYTPPAGSTLTGGSLDVNMYADGHGYDASGTAVAYTPALQYDGGDVFFQCAAGSKQCASGTTDYSGVIELPSDRGGDFYLGAGCGGIGGNSCNEGGSHGGWSVVEVLWARFLLSNAATPEASGISGTLLTPGARGTGELTFTATDQGGPGIYEATVQIDGKQVYAATPDTNGGKCVPVGKSGGALMFDYNQPCKASESIDLPIDTTSVTDGQHTLKIVLKDAAQNSSVVFDGTITTDNAPTNSSPPAILAPSQVFAGAALTVQPGAWSTPSGAGSATYAYQWEDCDAQGNNCSAIPGAQAAAYTPAPADVGHTLRVAVNASDNDGGSLATSAATSVVLSTQGSLGALPGPGTGPNTPGTGGGTTTIILGTGVPNGLSASEAALIRLGVRESLSRPYARRALSITGRLLNGQGKPIGNATLDVLQQPSGSSRLQAVGHVKTSSSGTFTAKVPAGPSRLVELAYRAWSADPIYAALASVKEAVAAGVQLRVTPRQVGSRSRIVLAGQVQGPIPKHGVNVELLVHYHGAWQPLRTPLRTDRHGRWRATYQFQGAKGRFPFKAVVPAGQAGFPFATGDSPIVNVKAA